MMAAENSNELFNYSIIEYRDNVDEKLEKQFKTLTSLLEGKSTDREINDAFTKHSSRGVSEHDEVNMGLLYKILIERGDASKWMNILIMINRDCMQCVSCFMINFVTTKFQKLQPIPKIQCVFLANEFIRAQINNADPFCYALLRQIVGGNLSSKNINLTEKMLDMFTINYSWLEKIPHLFQMVVYTFLRTIQDHVQPAFAALRQKEVNFVVKSLREHWDTLFPIGRDLVRMLICLRSIPEMEKLLEDIKKPNILSASYTGILSLFQTRTSKKFHVSRVTVEMEKKLRFIFFNVNKRNISVYQEFFKRQYLSTQESGTLRADIIRFICTCIHPSNDILGSEVTPRYLLINWLLKTSTHKHTFHNNLSLFWDWFMFAENRHSIMDIEPAILVMQHNARPLPTVTSNLLDFIFRIINLEVLNVIKYQMQGGVQAALNLIIKHRVVPSLAQILDTTRNNPELAALTRNYLGKLCNPIEGPIPSVPPPPPLTDPTDPNRNSSPRAPSPRPSSTCSEDDLVIIEDDSENEQNETKSPEESNPASFSDEDDDVIDAIHDKDDKSSCDTLERSKSDKNLNFSKALQKLDEGLQTAFAQFEKASSLSEKCDQIQEIVTNIITTIDWEEDQMNAVSTCFLHLLTDDCNSFSSLLPSEMTHEYLSSCIEKPIFIVFRMLWENRKDEIALKTLLLILSEVYSQLPKIGYLLLFYLSVLNPKKVTESVNLYKSFARKTQLSDLYNCLMMDLKTCQEADVNMLVYLTPYVFKTFPDLCLDNSEVFNIIVAAIDPLQLEELSFLIMMGDFSMMNKDSVMNILETSLDWETFEQYATWHLLEAHNIPFDVVLPLIQRLDPKAHAEALSHILFSLKRIEPTQDMVQHIISRRCIDVDRFTVSLLRNWAINYPKELADHLSVVLSKSKPRQMSQSRKSLRQRTHAFKRAQQGLASQPSTTDMLTHVDNLRKLSLPKSCEFFRQDSLIACLLQMHENFDEPCKSKFSELFSIASSFESDDDEVTLSNVKTSMKKRGKHAAPSRGSSASNRNKTSNKYTESGDSDDSEENVFQAKRRRRGRPAANESSGSD